ncbi:hypothetical protein [Candidatus Thiodictyon syntrophicum]|jgi:hypothetical protein|uniref:Uncharacterized protein n=1 Tax=Candidatus Thiodictyon syntrophicum TaxID=1166950 RepID=A0A2K8U3M7_9GAMM|nr:hypothetical protein [Candidatus Thiodictyon syntrophicum]AUB80147.1 hypothetical protein THSYN_03665 [Candidatus Thiodictyon syntrophicum]
MSLPADAFQAIRSAIAAIPPDASADAVGANAARLDEIYAPETHAAALDPATPIVLGSRGSGKSFWASVLFQSDTREAAARAYPRLGLDRIEVRFGYTGIGGPDGVSVDAIDKAVAPNGSHDDAKAFWWATILSAADRSAGNETARPSVFLDLARDYEAREDQLLAHENRLRAAGKSLLVVYDALDTVARTWPRRRLLTETLLEVVWAMRAYRAIRLKLFLRPDQLDDDALRFVELPKLRTGAIRLDWTAWDLYGLLFARLALAPDDDARTAFAALLQLNNLPQGNRDSILTHRWPLAYIPTDQKTLMTALAGPYMGQGAYAYKKGNTYDWPMTHLGDARAEVTPRSFLGMMIAAARHLTPPVDRVITPEGIRHGLRAASKTRVDQLHQEFPWIKGVLAPLAGLLLPRVEEDVYHVWSNALTVQRLIADAENNYLPPFPDPERQGEHELFVALERIGVMFRRKDGRLDMPDLFRVAAKLLRRGGIAPV